MYFGVPENTKVTLGADRCRCITVHERCRVTVLTESRASQRFPIKLPITVRTKDSREQFAETANISAGGVLFLPKVGNSTGTEIFFSLVAPAGGVGKDSQVLGRFPRGAGPCAGA